MEEYAKGAIVKIELTNFMTYESVVQHPGPKVNFILGRNGSGKSSIVCAIAICCGSSPSFIGRASTLSDFIKHGKDTAVVKLTLANPGGTPITLERILHRGKNSANECRINEGKVPWETYLTEVQKLNIMTDNLVQFLPQERVIDFSAMNAIQLLENTEKTIGHMNLSKMHDDLKEAGNTWKDAAGEIDRLRRTLDEAKDKEVQLVQEVEAAQYREEISTELSLAVLKRDRLHLVREQQKLRNGKEHLVQLDKELHSAADKVVPFQANMVKEKEVYLKINKNLKDAKARVERRINSYDPNPYVEIPITLQNENLTDIATLNAAEDEDRKRLQKIQTHKAAKENLEALSTQFDSTAIDVNIEEAAQKQRAARAHVTICSEKRMVVQRERRAIEDEIHARKTELERLKQSEDGLSKYLAETHHVAWTARKWIDANRGRMRGNIYGPLITEIVLHQNDHRFASILESLIPKDQHYMFICEYEEDVDLIMRELVREQRIRVPIKRVASDSRASFILNDQQRSQLKEELGCQCFVSDFFEAPGPVYRYLCNKFRMNSIPVFEKHTADLISRYQRVFSSGDVSALMLFAGNLTFRFRRTRFSSSLATNSSETRNSVILSALMIINRGQPDTTGAEAALAEATARSHNLRAKELAAQQAEQQANTDFTAATSELQGHRNFLNDKTRNNKRIADADREIRRLEMVEFDFAAEQAKIAVKIRERNLEALNKLLIREIQSEIAPPLLEEVANTALKFVQTGGELSRQSKGLRSCNEKMFTKWELLKQGLRAHKLAMKTFKADLNKHVELFENIPGANKATLPADKVVSYQKLPSGNAELTELIHSRRAQLSTAGGVNLNAGKELQAHRQATEKLQQVIAERNGDIAQRKNRMAQTKEKWMKTIQDLASKIGSGFADFYRSMNLAGDVILDRPVNPDHFEKYGFNIKVSYRANRPLETLCASVHSGGEKSVATALYMLAIQELTKCPFRVVDEINQGMDSENERRVFKMIVETASRCGGQYFILSPKLLPDLHLTSDVTVSIIFSGSYMHSGERLESWDLLGMGRRVKAINTEIGASQPETRASTSVVKPRKRPVEHVEDQEEHEETAESPLKKSTTRSVARTKRRLSTMN